MEIIYNTIIFLSGISSGLISTWLYWRYIPLSKKKAAINSLNSKLEDGELTVEEFFDVISELM
jgi:hypothetical protein